MIKFVGSFETVKSLPNTQFAEYFCAIIARPARTRRIIDKKVMIKFFIPKKPP